MDITELRQRPHLSASGMNDYTDCGLLYKLSRLDKFRPDFTPDSLVFGSAIHQVLADYNEARRQDYHLALEDLNSLFEGYWREKAEGNENISYKNGKDFNVLLADGKNLLKGFYENKGDNGYRVIAIEEPFEFTIEGMDIPVIGIIDLIEEDMSGTVVITDYKTAGKAYGIDDANRNFQLTLYWMAARYNGYTDREIILKLDALIKTKTPKFEPYYTARSEIDEQRAIKKIRSIWNGIQKGVFIPNDNQWKCPNCGFKKHCNDWFGGSS